MIHPTALVDPSAIISHGVKIGAFCIIGADVEIGENTEIKNNVTIEGPTKIGKECVIYPYSAIGMAPQDKKFKGEKSTLIIGDQNMIRECVTLNRGTQDGDYGTEHGLGETRIGNRGWLMAYTHVAHDCIVGDDVVFANGTGLCGHAIIGNKVITGGYSVIHQFCTIADYAITGAQSMISQDVTPHTTVAGNRAKPSGLNKLGLERNGFSKERIKIIEKTYKIVFRSKLTKVEALEKLKNEYSDSEDIKLWISLIENSQRGICR